MLRFFLFVYNYKCLKPSKILHVWKPLTALISRTWTHGHKKELSFCSNKGQILTMRVPWPCPGFPGLHLGSVPPPFFVPQVFSRLRTLGLHLASSGGPQGIREGTVQSQRSILSSTGYSLDERMNERMNQSMNKWKRKGKGEIKGGEADLLDSWEWSGVKEWGLFCSLLGGLGPEQLMASPQLSRDQRLLTSFKCLSWHSFHEGRLLVLSMCVLRTGFVLFNFISFVQQILFFFFMNAWQLEDKHLEINNLLISSRSLTADVWISSVLLYVCMCVWSERKMVLGFCKNMDEYGILETLRFQKRT